MRYIDKTHRLKEWDDYIRDSKPTKWSNSSSSKRLRLHKHLHLQQNGLCIYCEQKVQNPVGDTKNARDSSDVEHVLPKSDVLFIAWIFEQDNLAMSCRGFREGKYELDAKGRVKTNSITITQDFCGHSKDKFMDYDLFIDPFIDKETHKYFTFDINGNVLPSSKNPIKAAYTIELLNLNHDDLVAWRLEVYNTLLEDAELDITSHLSTFPIFYSMVRNLWGIA